MLIIGAKGFAKEVLEICIQNQDTESLCFYDDVNKDAAGKLYEKFDILKSSEEAQDYFKNTDPRFTIGLGKPQLRKKMYEKFSGLSGTFTSTISKSANIGSHGIRIGAGSNILPGAIISNDVEIGLGAIIYYNSIITHDVIIGDFVEISPGAKLLGRSKIGDFTSIGANATILPDVSVGNNVVIGAGSVIIRDIPDNSVVVGVPGRIIKHF